MTDHELAVQLGEIRGELVAIRQHLELQNGRLGRGEQRMDTLEHRQEKAELAAARSGAWHDQHDRDHTADERLAAVRGSIVLTRTGLARLAATVAAAAGGGMALAAAGLQYLGGR